MVQRDDEVEGDSAADGFELLNNHQIFVRLWA